jgi:hypothetical protein
VDPKHHQNVDPKHHQHVDPKHHQQVKYSKEEIPGLPMTHFSVVFKLISMIYALS